MMTASARTTLLGVDVLWVATMLAGRRRVRGDARDLRRDHRARPDGEARQGAQRSPRTAEGRHHRLDQAPRQAGPARTRPPTGSAAILSSLKVLQDSQVKVAQIKLMQAGIRSKE